MAEHLPHHGFVELPVPAGGVNAAVARGRHLRRRRTALRICAAVATTGLAVAAALSFGGSPGLGARDRLVPAHDPGLVPGPTPTVTGAARPGAATSGSRPSSPLPSPSAPAQQPQGRPSPSPRVAGGSVPETPYRTPALTRTYTPPRPLSASPSVSVCGANYAGSTDGTGQTRANWCVDEQVTPSARGRDLVLQLCRDQSGAAPLTFPGGREVEIVVSRAGHEVWRWSADHPDRGPAHTLDTPATACWTWTAPWTTVDQHGRPLPAGAYTMLATTQAAEVATFPSDAVAFSV